MLQWYGKRVTARIEAEITAKLIQSAKIVQHEAKSSMKPNLGVRFAGGDVVRSSPGEAPYQQTKKLHDSIGILKEPRRLAVRIGTDVKYGKYQELGTRKQKWRPWLLPALARSISKIKAIFAKPIGVTGSIMKTETMVDSTIYLSPGTSNTINEIND